MSHPNEAQQKAATLQHEVNTFIAENLSNLQIFTVKLYIKYSLNS